MPSRYSPLAPLLLVSTLTAQAQPPAELPAQDPPAASADAGQERQPIVVTATRREQDPFDVPYTTAVIDQELIRRRAYRTTPQALRDVPGVMVQETAHGHGSPYIRGFTSFRNLFLIDGVRLNNSVFRSGPNQYWNTVDPLSVERIELVKGPSSVLYGSDAVGGTVHAITKSPVHFGDGEQVTYGGGSYLRYASAEDSIQGRAEFGGGFTWGDGSQTGFLLGGSAKFFGDLEGGRGVGEQNNTGYDELDLDVKVEHWLDGDSRFVFLHQSVDQNEVPRTHRTVDALTWRGLSQGSDLQRDFDQDRHLTYLQYHHESDGGAIQALRANVSLHQQDETRDRIRSTLAQELQGFEVDTLGAWVQLESETPIGTFAYGAEYYRDDVDSFFRRSGAPQVGDDIQGPVADDATYDLLGVYVQDQIELADDFELTLGGRFTYAAADADSVRDPVTDTRIALDDSWEEFTGSARFRYGLLPDRLNLYGGVSQGFRAPNLSDLTRFDTARSNEFEIPATGLQEEDYISYEIGLRWQSEDVVAEATYFYTDIEDQILRFPTGNVNGSGDAEVTRANVGDGQVYGVEGGLAWDIAEQWTLFGNITYMEGEVTNFETAGAAASETYLTRLMPITGQGGLRWESEQRGLWAETVVVAVGTADKLSFGDVRDTSRIPPGGTPSYTLWHLRGGWDLNERTSIDVLLENVTDVDYRVHGSGLNRPGRNLIFGMQTTF